MLLYNKLMCCWRSDRAQMFPQVRPINCSDLTHEEFKVGEDGQYCFPKLELIKEQRTFKVQRLEIIAMSQCQFTKKRYPHESKLNASQMLEASTIDWKVSLDLLRTVHKRLETTLNEHGEGSRSGGIQPVHWASVGFNSNEAPESDLKDVGLLGLLVLMDFAQSAPKLTA